MKKTEKLIDAIRHEISWRMPSVELVIDEDNISFSFIMTDKDKILGSIDKTERLLKELRNYLNKKRNKLESMSLRKLVLF